jgi:hypothetical protein
MMFGNIALPHRTANAPAHRERPERILSDLAESQRGRDGVARMVSRIHTSDTLLGIAGKIRKSYLIPLTPALSEPGEGTRSPKLETC